MEKRHGKNTFRLRKLAAAGDGIALGSSGTAVVPTRPAGAERAMQLFRDSFTYTSPQARVYNLTGAVCACAKVCLRWFETINYPDRGVFVRSHFLSFIGNNPLLTGPAI